MPTIICAEYLSYYNSSRNSDKLFNIFLIRNDDNTYSCLTENGRRGSSLVRRTVCENVRRETAETKFWEKVREKRNHRETPYTNESFGGNYSQIASQANFNSESNTANKTTETKTTETKTDESKTNVIAFPTERIEKERKQPQTNGILNTEQFDSLEF